MSKHSTNISNKLMLSASHPCLHNVTDSCTSPCSDHTIGLWRMRTSYDVSPELSDAS